MFLWEKAFPAGSRSYRHLDTMLRKGLDRTPLPVSRLHFSQPGKPIQNCFVESFDGKFRDECLNENWFVDIPHARRIIEGWRVDYDKVRPHSAPESLSPRAFAERAA